MNYTPPPLNDTTSSTLKKTDSTLYRIQLENPGMDTAEDTEILLRSTMRELLAEITATVTQVRLDNLHKGLDLPGKPTQFLESENKLLIDQEALDALISKKPAAKIQRVQPFCKRQKSTTSNELYSSNNVTAPNTAAATTTEVNHRTSDRQSNFPGRGRGRGRGSHVERIQNPLHEPKISDVESVIGKFCANINRLFVFSNDGFDVGQSAEAPCPRHGPYGPTADVSPASEKTEAEPGDEDTDVDMQNDPSEGLSDVTRPPGCFHAHPGLQEVPKVPPLSLEWPLLLIPHPAIRTITEPFGLHQDPPPSSGMGQIARDSCLCISRRFANHGRIQGRVPNEHSLYLFQAFAAWIQGQFREVVDHAISVDHPHRNDNQLQRNVPQGSIQQYPGSATRGQQTTERCSDDSEEFGELHWESPINIGRSTSWKADATPSTRAQKPSSVNIEFMDIDSDSDET
ncbi:hypothetical protein AYI69_g9471, partial [Smittium culicis]